MIAVDASAVLAILLLEAEAAEFKALLERTGGRISPVNLWEVTARAHALGGADGVAEARRLLSDLSIEVTEIGEPAARLALAAFARFGKGTGRGPLNLGDCFAYALAQVEGDGLLFKGDDFTKTDVKPAI
ncbi:type II toxin-antitoxin system VapC family toxin [Phenylobacterium sp.]|uniref:type II toxin-antitoxin system VapC family toxin n=1 Tax=Phenylobacterium sp. TaxID=1871053 RepID=UPI0025EEA990|nr:type II toxin-antitoxin system VapC family toxin [Phenylobacterium sp.]MBX3485662.1 type II toxin-antitoxin system VapC family toxin [Phenylobacterium sp.]MCW5761597.1 type II toxin-antitoxin system VapC family toxin [Phenylobacterium sp.]